MLLFIPSIVINAVLVTLATYAMWTRGIDLAPVERPGRRPQLQSVPANQELAAA